MTTEFDNTAPMAEEHEPDAAEAASDQEPVLGEPQVVEEYTPPSKPTLIADEEAAAEAAEAEEAG
jgi:hypothetical protein